MMIDLYDLRFEALAAFLAELSEPAYRARQLWEWLYVKLVDDFAVMNNLPLTLRRTLAEKATLTRLNPVVKLDSSDGQTR